MGQTFTCPNCGVALGVHVITVTRSKYEPRQWQSFGHDIGPGSPPPLQAGTSWQRREPVRAPCAQDVVVPAAWAGLTGVALALLSVGPVIVWEWPWYTPVFALTGGAGATWLLLLVRWQGLLWRIEEIFGVDLDGDKSKGEPRRVTEIVFQDKDKRSTKFVSLPIDEATLRSIAKVVMSGSHALSRRGLSGVISDDAYRKLQAALLEEGWAAYKGASPNEGIALTGAGRAVMRHFAAAPPPPE